MRRPGAGEFGNFGDFEDLVPIGAGGMGEVYRC
jgi:hypothetical protein